MNKICVSLLICLISLNANAADWKGLGFVNSPMSPGNRYKIFIDVDSINRNGDSVTFWTRAIFSPPANIKYNDGRVIPTLERREYREIDCSKKMIKLLSSRFATETQEMITRPGDNYFEAIMPESGDEAYFREACKGLAKRLIDQIRN